MTLSWRKSFLDAGMPVLLLFSIVLFPAGCLWRRGGVRTELECFVGSASKPAVEELAAEFEKKEGVRVLLHFGGSGKVLSQMRIARRGDVYLPGSSDFMEKAKAGGDVKPETERIVAYLLPAMVVRKGNPKNIRRLEDLARPGVRVGLARPRSVCVGLYAVEILMKAGLYDKVLPNVVAYAESCSRTARLVAMGDVDVIMGWRVFEKWTPDRVEAVMIEPSRIPRIGYIPAAVSSYSRHPALASRFVSFLVSKRGREVFRKWGYISTLEEARRYTLPDTPVGGAWKLPENMGGGSGEGRR